MDDNKYKELIMELAKEGLIGDGTTLVEAGRTFIKNRSDFRKIIEFLENKWCVEPKEHGGKVK